MSLIGDFACVNSPAKKAKKLPNLNLNFYSPQAIQSFEQKRYAPPKRVKQPIDINSLRIASDEKDSVPETPISQSLLQVSGQLQKMQGNSLRSSSFTPLSTPGAPCNTPQILRPPQNTPQITKPPQNTPLAASNFHPIPPQISVQKTPLLPPRIKHNSAQSFLDSNKENVYDTFTAKNNSQNIKTGKISDYFMTSKTSEKLTAKQLNSKPQQVFDLGQKNFGAKTCKECGMTFNRSINNDRDAHRIYHNLALQSTKFSEKILQAAVVKKDVEIVENFLSLGHRILKINGRGCNPEVGEFGKKMAEFRKFVDGELGSNVECENLKAGQKCYLYWGFWGTDFDHF